MSDEAKPCSLVGVDDRTLQVDLVIRGGRVIDPCQGIDAYLDVLIKNGKILELTPDASAVPAKEVVDVQGALVVPGLIDLHTHTYYGMSGYSVEPDLCFATWPR